jgi:hypothetical protein
MSTKKEQCLLSLIATATATIAVLCVFHARLSNSCLKENATIALALLLPPFSYSDQSLPLLPSSDE